MTIVFTREYEPTDRDEIRQLRLRANDIKELQAVRPGVPMPDIIEEATESEVCYVALIEERIVALFGCTPHASNPQFGVVWAFGTPEAYEAMGALNKIAANALELWGRHYPDGLGNIMSVDNNPAVKWVKAFGFKFTGRDIWLSGVRFRAFNRGASDV